MDHIAAQIPFVRRYARALTGNQTTGDAYAVAVLEAMIADPATVPGPDEARKELFRMFHAIWQSSGAPVGDEERGIAARAQQHLATLQPLTREALLLSAMEDFSDEDIGYIMGIDADEAGALVVKGTADMADAVRGSVLIIEDEPIISMDLEQIVSDAGHRIFGVARTHDEAVKLGQDQKPDLILADIRLADESSGIDAVNDLLAAHGEIPVIFITAYPERLLTGDKPEPAFLVTKPFRAEHVLSSISQAMFFASTETLA
ncbi:response regulator [Aliiroseovarius sp. PTFE2010]|uniref:response regulator n=1 Tax=Aliiroseovarius sp. PTFE2010 TaxID=3417190 RepID=UPI003CEB4F12